MANTDSIVEKTSESAQAAKTSKVVRTTTRSITSKIDDGRPKQSSELIIK